MATGKKPNTAAVCEELAKPVLEEMGLTLWDLRYEKEGSIWFLRYFIDKEGGVGIDDCVAMSHALDKPLDEADPIDRSYCLEVSSPGTDRELTRPAHFDAFIGAQVVTRLIRPLETGERELHGTLEGHDAGSFTLNLGDERVIVIDRKEASWVRLDDSNAI